MRVLPSANITLQPQRAIARAPLRLSQAVSIVKHYIAAKMSELVLVTGGSGFIASWCILYALQRGYRVRTTVRSLNKADAVRTMITNGGLSKDQVDSIEFAEADLTKDEGWTEACQGCTYVLVSFSNQSVQIYLLVGTLQEQFDTPKSECLASNHYTVSELLIAQA